MRDFSSSLINKEIEMMDCYNSYSADQDSVGHLHPFTPALSNSLSLSHHQHRGVEVFLGLLCLGPSWWCLGWWWCLSFVLFVGGGGVGVFVFFDDAEKEKKKKKPNPPPVPTPPTPTSIPLEKEAKG